MKRKARTPPAQAASSPWKRAAAPRCGSGGEAAPRGRRWPRMAERGQPCPAGGAAPSTGQCPHPVGWQPLLGAGVTALPVPERGRAAPSPPPAPRQPHFVFIYRLPFGGGHPSFVAVVGIFDESFGMRCWQRFCINISDNMFRQISSLKLFALFDKGRGAAWNATGLMCSLLPTRRAIIRPVAPCVNIQLF